MNYPTELIATPLSTMSAMVSPIATSSLQPVQIINNIPKSSFIEQLIPALIGILGVFVGVLTAEYFKRKERVSLFSEEVFKRRLEVYENLFDRLKTAYDFADLCIDGRRKRLSIKEQKDAWQSYALGIAEFADDNKLYLNENVILHCVGSLMGVDDLFDMPKDKRKLALKKYYQHRLESTDMIREITGLKKIESYFNDVNKPKISSELIEYADNLRKKSKEKNK